MVGLRFIAMAASASGDKLNLKVPATKADATARGPAEGP
jgi:hypothetical protein